MTAKRVSIKKEGNRLVFKINTKRTHLVLLGGLPGQIFGSEGCIPDIVEKGSVYSFGIRLKHKARK
ncbi:MAG: hypothetical protein WCW87_02620 [Candidatus Paceibacterota bacterium]